MVQFYELKGFIDDSSMNFYEKPVLYPDLHLSSDSKPSRRHENISLLETFAVLSSITVIFVRESPRAIYIFLSYHFALSRPRYPCLLVHFTPD